MPHQQAKNAVLLNTSFSISNIAIQGAEQNISNKDGKQVGCICMTAVDLGISGINSLINYVTSG